MQAPYASRLACVIVKSLPNGCFLAVGWNVIGVTASQTICKWITRKGAFTEHKDAHAPHGPFVIA